MTTTLRLDDDQATALRSALDSYLDGYGMPDQDEDEEVLTGIMEMLDEAGA